MRSVSCCVTTLLLTGALVTPFATGETILGTFLRHEVRVYQGGYALAAPATTDFTLYSPTGRVDLSFTGRFPGLAEYRNLTLEVSTTSNSPPVHWVDTRIYADAPFRLKLSGDLWVGAEQQQIVWTGSSGTTHTDLFERAEQHLYIRGNSHTDVDHSSSGGFTVGTGHFYRHSHPPPMGETSYTNVMDFVTLFGRVPDSELGLQESRLGFELATGPYSHPWMYFEVRVATYFEFSGLDGWSEPNDDWVAVLDHEPRTGRLTTGSSPTFTADARHRLGTVAEALLRLEMRDADGVSIGSSTNVAISGQGTAGVTTLAVPSFSIPGTVGSLRMVAVLEDTLGGMLDESTACTYGVYEPETFIEIVDSSPASGRELEPGSEHAFAATVSYSLQTQPEADLLLELLDVGDNVIAQSAPIRVTESLSTAVAHPWIGPTHIDGTSSNLFLRATLVQPETSTRTVVSADRTRIVTSPNRRYDVGQFPEEIRVISVVGDAELLRAGAADQPIPLTAGEVLYRGDSVWTLLDASVRIEFPDGTVIEVGELADLRITEHTLQGETVRTRLWLKAGEVTSSVNHAASVRSDFQIKTPTATLSVRGTVFYTKYVDTPVPTTTVQLGDGELLVTPVNPFLPVFNPLRWETVTITKDVIDGDYTTTAAAPRPYIDGYHVKALAQITDPHNLALADDGTLYVQSRYTGEILEVRPDGTTTNVASFWHESSGWNGLSIDSNGTLYVSHTAGCDIRRITSTGSNETFAVGIDYPGRMTPGEEASLFVGSEAAGRTYRIAAGEQPDDYLLPSLRAVGLATDTAGAVYSCDNAYKRILVAAPNAAYETLAHLSFAPGAMTFDGGNTFFVAAEGNDEALGEADIYTVSMDGTEAVIGGGFSQPVDMVGSLDGILYIADIGNQAVYEAVPFGLRPARVDLYPDSLSFGEVIVADFRDASVRLLNAGDSTLNVTSITCTASECAVTAPAFPFALPPGSTTNISVRFVPSELGELEADLQIASDAPSNAVATVSLHGTGVGSQEPATLPNGALYWWPFETNAHERLTGTPSLLHGSPAHGPGEVERGLTLDGTNDAIEIPDSLVTNLDLSGGFTVEGWVRPGDVDVCPILELDCYYNESYPAYPAIQLFLYGTADDGSDKHIQGVILNSSGGYRILAGFAMVTPGRFHHVALSLDAAQGIAKLYVNGEKVEHDLYAGAFTPFPPSALWIGHSSALASYPNRNYAGTLDEITLYNRALAEDELQAVYLAAAHGKDFARPHLTQERTDPGQLVLAWPDGFTDATLQKRHDLTQPPEWQDVPASSVLSNGYHRVTLDTGDEKRTYYRLRTTVGSPYSGGPVQ